MLWERYDLLILDLDGVVYIGAEAVPAAIESLNAVSDRVRLSAATNNAARPAAAVGEHLRQLGLSIAGEDVVTSAQAGAALLAEQLEPGAKVLAVGGAGVSLALSEVGLIPVRADDDLERSGRLAREVSAVMQGHGPESSWRDFAAATFAINAGAKWLATNLDATVPLPMGFGPGNGAFVQAIRYATGAEPQVAGKPQPTLFAQTIKRMGARRALVIGDRLDTDIDGALAAGMDSLLVFTGVAQPQDLESLPSDRLPTYAAPDLSVLTAAAPPPQLRVQGARLQ